jgi:hypothetical protein
LSQEYRRKVKPKPTMAPATAATNLFTDIRGGVESFSSDPFFYSQ